MSMTDFTWKKPLPQRLYRRWKMKIGKIFDLMTTPCANDSFTAFVLAPFAELPTLLYSLTSHECLDAAWDKTSQSWKKLQNQKGGRHGRGGTPTFRSGGLVRNTGPIPSGVGWAAFAGGQFLQSLGAKILIMDTALNWNINWMSTALQWSGCQPEPDTWSSGTLVGPVYGDHCDLIRMGCNGIGGGKNCIAGIGGFATTVPVSTIHVMGSLNCIPFGSAPFVTMGEGEWQVFNALSHEELTMTSETHGEDNISGTGRQLWQKGSFYLTGAQRVEGFFGAVDPCTPGQGGQIGYSPYYVTGDLTTSLQAAIGADPCDGGIMTQLGGFRR